jgi:hypothetical protein
MIFNEIIFKLLEEQNIIKTTKTKPIVDAIKNRNKISFYYSGPRKGKDSVKSGYRVKVEPVAIGLSKKGNLILRGYTQPPSTTKTGFAKHGWRTFILGRMGNVQVTDEIFNEKRPGYKEGPDGSMTTTYVTVDWGKTPEVKKPRIVKPKPVTAKVEPKPVKPEVKPTEPKVEPQKQELPQPKPEVKPQPSPEPEKVDINKNQELPEPKPEETPTPNPEEDSEDKNLQESIKRIKSLMLL